MHIDLDNKEFELSEPEKVAILIIKTFMDCYNQGDGVGLFSGIERYSMLEGRIKIAAVQSQNLMDFWGNLRSKLQVPLTLKKYDSKIVKFWEKTEQVEILQFLAGQAGEAIMIARMLYDQDKQDKLKK